MRFDQVQCQQDKIKKCLPRYYILTQIYVSGDFPELWHIFYLIKLCLYDLKRKQNFKTFVTIILIDYKNVTYSNMLSWIFIGVVH